METTKTSTAQARRSNEAFNLDDFDPGANPKSQLDRMEAMLGRLTGIVEKALGADTITDMKQGDEGFDPLMAAADNRERTLRHALDSASRILRIAEENGGFPATQRGYAKTMTRIDQVLAGYRAPL